MPGRRRVGQGDSFWQYRPFLPGDSSHRIDWRASAKSDRSFIRETEWEAAQTVYLWRDSSPSMAWRSGSAVPFKRERADLLLLALAALLFRGGERVRLVGAPTRLRGGHGALEDLAQALADIEGGLGLPPAIPVSGHLLQVLDPAEALLPYSGRVRFRGLEQEADALVPRVEGIRRGYAEALSAQLHGLASLCTAADWGFGTHRTDHAPEAALLGLYVALTTR